jgi:hypothetical protein
VPVAFTAVEVPAASVVDRFSARAPGSGSSFVTIVVYPAMVVAGEV